VSTTPRSPDEVMVSGAMRPNRSDTLPGDSQPATPYDSEVTRPRSTQNMLAQTKLEGCVAIVTGATGGIGRAIVTALAEEGVRLVLGGKRPTPQELPDRAVYLPGDVCDEPYPARLVELALEEFGGLDILVNSHGLDFHSGLPTTSLEEARHILDVNVLGALATMKYAIPAMELNGGGSIVNIGSRLGQVAIEGQALYSASKGALIMLSRGAAIDHARAGIRVNVVAPGVTSTDMIEYWVNSQANPTTFRNQLAAAIPMGRFAEPRDVASAVVFFASPASAYITGAVLPVDGGYTSA
jgi:NAD(P)-dependent dehydrogenase (short-subunit alcohol dehydrogenase family)